MALLMKRITIIIPVYNGEQYIKNTMEELAFWYTKISFFEVIVVNDGSTDNTKTLLDAYALSAPFPLSVYTLKQNYGKGYAIRYAMQHATQTDIIGFTDIELPYGLNQLIDIQKQFEQNPMIDIIIGKREKSRDSYTPIRYLYKNLFRMFIPQKVRSFHDTQCGYKWFQYQAAQDIFSVLQTNRWVVDIELLLAANVQHKQIQEISVQLKPTCRTRGNISLWKHGLHIIYDLYRIRTYEQHCGYHKKT